MKVSSIIEANVVDFKSRQQKHADLADLERKRAVKNVLDSLDRVIELAIEKLVNQGVEDNIAKKTIINHLGDVVMAHDLNGWNN